MDLKELERMLHVATGAEWERLLEVFRAKHAEYIARFPKLTGRVLVSRVRDCVAFSDYHKIEIAEGILAVTAYEQTKLYKLADVVDEKGQLNIGVSEFIKKPLGAE